ncbi:hypothetical protein FPQ18DRAFT_341432 [Pyronema domesticum]|nr:hypothetical protein FPQ18DRAFT_341432 [Pyronema domesticum]
MDSPPPPSSPPASLPNRRLSLRNARLSAPSIPLRRRSISRPRSLHSPDEEWESDSGEPSTSTGDLLSPPRRAPSPGYLYHHRRGRSSDGNGKYIEYLEKQISDLSSQVSSVDSGRLRKLNSEVRLLRGEVAEWEARFETRVKEALEDQQVRQEGRREESERLRGLLEDKECSLRLANAEISRLRRMVDVLREVEEVNQRLEYRVDTLTELLSRPQSRPASVVSAPSASGVDSRRVSAESLRNVESAGSTRSEARLEDFGVDEDHWDARRSSGEYPPGSTSTPLRSRRMRKFASTNTPKSLVLSGSAVTSAQNSPQGNRPSLSHRNSLFAELARVQSDAESDAESDNAPTPQPLPEIHLDPPRSSAGEHDRPLIVKVLGSVSEGLTSPTRTFFTAKRKALDIASHVVTRRPPGLSKRTRRSIGDLPPPSLRNRKGKACKECGAIRNTLAPDGAVWRKHREEDGLEVVWLWVRFIIAVVVALGLAVKDGPPDMEEEGGFDEVREEERERALRRLEGGE